MRNSKNSSKFLIDPSKITNFERIEEELELFILFCAVVAGKNARVQAQKLDAFLTDAGQIFSPFGLINQYKKNNSLAYHLRHYKLGQYTRLEKTFKELLTLRGKLKTCSVEDLENIHGIGPKTARFFLLHSRPNMRLAVLDTHLLKFLKQNGINAPKSTPSKGKYAELERKFLDICDKKGIDPAVLDLEIWNTFSKK